MWTVSKDGTTLRFEIGVQYRETADNFRIEVRDGPVDRDTLVFRDGEHRRGHPDLFDILAKNLREAGVPAHPEEC